MDRLKSHNALAAAIDMYTAMLREAEEEIAQLRAALAQEGAEVDRLRNKLAEVSERELKGRSAVEIAAEKYVASCLQVGPGPEERHRLFNELYDATKVEACRK